MTKHHTTHDRSTRLPALLVAISAALLLLPPLVGCDNQASATGSAESATPGPESTSSSLPESAPAPAPAPADTTPVADPPAAVSVGDTEPHPVDGDTARDGVRVRRLVVAHDIVDREPVLGAPSFEAGVERVYAFVDGANSNAEDQRVVVTFEGPDGRVVGHVGLDLPASRRRWRTWAFTRNIGAPGTWFAVVRTEDGHELARRPFEVR